MKYILILLWSACKESLVEVVTSDPKIPYRETIKIAANNIEGKHKKQSGGHGQYGHVFINLEPNYESEFEFHETIFGGAVPKQFRQLKRHTKLCQKGF